MTKPIKIFVSVGRTRDASQADFINAIEARLKAEGLIPCTVGRNFFKNKNPLIAVSDLMKECQGAMVIALERLNFPKGIELRGHPDSKVLSGVKLPTVWNQTEAAMAYAHHLPMFLIAEKGLRSEGFLESNYDWPVHWVKVSTAELNSAEFNGALSDWKSDVVQRALQPPLREEDADENVAEETPFLIGSSDTKSALFTGVASVLAILATTIGMLILASNYASKHFFLILGAVFPLVILGLAFVARVSGLIGSGQMVSLFKLAGKRSNKDSDKPTA